MMSTAARWEHISRYLFGMCVLLVLFAGFGFYEGDVTGGLMTLVPAGACGLFAYFARCRHDKIAFGTPTPRWLVAVAVVAAAAGLMLGIFANAEDVERDLRMERAAAERASW
jgi:hypothetical protein